MNPLNTSLQSSLPNETILQILLDNTVENFVLVDHDYQVIAYNDYIAKNVRDQSEQKQTLTLGVSFLQVAAPTVVDKLEQALVQAFQGEKVTIEMALPKQWLETRFIPIWVANEIKYVSIFGTDITKTKQAQIDKELENIELANVITQQSEELVELNQAKETILEAATEVAFIATNTEGIITTFSPGAEKMLGYKAAELVGKATPLLFHNPREVAAYRKQLSLKLGRKLGKFETFVAMAILHGSENRDWFYCHKTGRTLIVNLTITCMRNHKNEITGYLGVALDITKRKEAEQNLQQLNQALELRVAEKTASMNDSLLVLQDEIIKRQATHQKLLMQEAHLQAMEAKYRRLFEQAPIMYITTIYHDGNYFINNCNDAFLNTLDYRLEEVLGKPLTQFYSLKSQQLVTNLDTTKIEFPLQERVLIRRDGQEVITLVKLIPEQDAQGNLSGMWAMYTNITQRLQAEQALRRSEKNYRILASNIPHCDIFLFDHDLRFLVAEGSEMKRHGFKPSDFEGKILTETLDKATLDILEPLYRRAIAGEEVSVELYYGGEYYYQQFMPIRNAAGEVFAAMTLSQNITNRKLTELALQQSEEKWRSLVASMPSFITMVNPQGEIEFINRVDPSYNYSAEQMVGLLASTMIAPEHHAIFQSTLKSVFETGEIAQYEVVAVMGDGSNRWYENRLGPIKNGGQITSVVIMSQDITEKQMNLELITQQARSLAQSNTDLQNFAYIASHDLQEPLRKIQTFGARLQDKFAAAVDSRGQDYLARMISAAERGQQLVQNLLAYSRISTQNQPFVNVDLAASIAEVLIDLELSIEQSQAQVIVTPPLPTIQGDPSQMQQLLYNLVSNALKFQRPGVAPQIQITAEVTRPSSSQPTSWCHLTIRDNGIGIEEKYWDKIFAPFQRLHTRQEYIGNGMGLAICRKIASQHGGHITVHSTLGQGSTFIVSLPM